MAIVLSHEQYKCEYLTDPSDDRTKCQRTRTFRLRTNQLCHNVGFMCKSLELEKSNNGYESYCELHAILVHFRKNNPPIEPMDKDNAREFEGIGIIIRFCPRKSIHTVFVNQLVLSNKFY